MRPRTACFERNRGATRHRRLLEPARAGSSTVFTSTIAASSSTTSREWQLRLEEVVVDAHPLDAEDLGEQVALPRLEELVLRRAVRAATGRRRRQRGAVDLVAMVRGSSSSWRRSPRGPWSRARAWRHPPEPPWRYRTRSRRPRRRHESARRRRVDAHGGVATPAEHRRGRSRPRWSRPSRPPHLHPGVDPVDVVEHPSGRSRERVRGAAACDRRTSGRSTPRSAPNDAPVARRRCPRRTATMRPGSPSVFRLLVVVDVGAPRRRRAWPPTATTRCRCA